ncbi:unnamed protein product [Ilex paraguariensis]|uniref:Light-harvesting complex-like protein 3 isotype 1, chloroplastic n=1 Tax=Ilex paraguariensis TaxID=185542 RepID=A0ABC8V3U1_9AQUA
MVSIPITSSMQIAFSSQHATKRPQPQARQARSSGTMPATHVVTLNVKQQERAEMLVDKSNDTKDEVKRDEMEGSVLGFVDERWKKGTWDLNMFVKDGKMDWDGVIVAEARRRKFLELHPETAANQAPVLFRTSIIPWWAWVMHSHLPEAELLNGRAAMVGFFMAYSVDALTQLDVVGQTGNFICKFGLLVTVIGVLLFRRTQDFENLQKVADAATFYDKQWKASWQNEDATTGGTPK